LAEGMMKPICLVSRVVMFESWIRTLLASHVLSAEQS